MLYITNYSGPLQKDVLISNLKKIIKLFFSDKSTWRNCQYEDWFKTKFYYISKNYKLFITELCIIYPP